MWIYEKKLQFPIDVKTKDLRFAKTLIAQYGGPYCKQILQIPYSHDQMVIGYLLILLS